MTAEIIRKAQVICCTCIGAGEALLAEQYFPFVLLDESTQAIEPATLVPLMKGAQHVVLLGDHHQLPPTVTSERALRGGLRQSLFERLIAECALKPCVLVSQYRMHPTCTPRPFIFMLCAVSASQCRTSPRSTSTRASSWTLCSRRSAHCPVVLRGRTNNRLLLCTWKGARQ